jgi:hypothetical protein
MAEQNVADVLLFLGGSSSRRLGDPLTHILRGSDVTEFLLLTLHNVHYRRCINRSFWRLAAGTVADLAGRVSLSHDPPTS